ncbi:MAG: hypothetical protein GXP49_14205 [Deltaproteobacteria bacterium]|nr:hypothetical protein [Deltaproteobacteria bacterium]
MRFFARTFSIIIAVCLLEFLFACGDVHETTGDQGKQPTVGDSYRSACMNESQYDNKVSSIAIMALRDKIIIVDHHAEFNCCLKSWMEADINLEAKLITVTEMEDSDRREACECTCPFEMALKVKDLPQGRYSVNVYRQDIDARTLLAVLTVQIPGKDMEECLADKDCPAGMMCKVNVCMQKQPVGDQCLEAGGKCMADTNGTCPAGTHVLEAGPNVCAGAGGVICCLPGCLSDSDCAVGESCKDGGLCEKTCTPTCDGRECGDDGCFGSCGTCPEGETCNEQGMCDSVCSNHEDCGGATDKKWCIRGECLAGDTPCEAAGGTCTIENECPDGTYQVKDPSYMHCAFGGHCCLPRGCPDLVTCPEGMVCGDDGTCKEEGGCACSIPPCAFTSLSECNKVAGCEVRSDPLSLGPDICAIDLQANCERTGGTWHGSMGMYCECPEGTHVFSLSTCVPNSCKECSDLRMLDKDQAFLAAKRIRKAFLLEEQGDIAEWMQDRTVGDIGYVQRRKEERLHPDIPGWYASDEYILAPIQDDQGLTETWIFLSALDGSWKEVDHVNGGLSSVVTMEEALDRVSDVSGRQTADFKDPGMVYVEVGPGNKFGNFNGSVDPFWRFLLDGEEWFVMSRLDGASHKALVFRSMDFIPVN